MKGGGREEMRTGMITRRDKRRKISKIQESTNEDEENMKERQMKDYPRHTCTYVRTYVRTYTCSKYSHRKIHI